MFVRHDIAVSTASPRLSSELRVETCAVVCPQILVLAILVIGDIELRAT